MPISTDFEQNPSRRSVPHRSKRDGSPEVRPREPETDKWRRNWCESGELWLRAGRPLAAAKSARCCRGSFRLISDHSQIRRFAGPGTLSLRLRRPPPAVLVVLEPAVVGVFGETRLLAGGPPVVSMRLPRLPGDGDLTLDLLRLRFGRRFLGGRAGRDQVTSAPAGASRRRCDRRRTGGGRRVRGGRAAWSSARRLRRPSRRRTRRSPCHIRTSPTIRKAWSSNSSSVGSWER